VLTVAVLGVVEVRRDGGLLHVPTGKTSELLVRLALDVGSRVRTEVLIEDLWSGSAGRNTLQSKVSQLRRALGDKDLVVGSGDGYVLELDPTCVDAVRVVTLAAETSAARSTGDAAIVLAKGNEALAMFPGEVLIESGDWAGPRRARLGELRLGLIEDVMSARVDLGSGGEVVGELETLVEQHPLREGLWSSLITSLYRAGRQAEALAAYTRVRRLLVDELGIEPGAALQSLEREVLQQSTTLGGTTRDRAVVVPGNLPRPTVALVGRGDDVAALITQVQQRALVTVVGPAGVGKTRLMLEVAQGLEATGGVWLVRLEAVDRASSLAQVVAEALHVTGGEQALRERLAGAETVLLLDNCEHVVESVGTLVGALHDAAPRLRILTTSQVPLGVDGEHVYHLGPLSGAGSVELFTRRAQEMRRQFVLDSDTEDLVDEVCRALDGLPLAIELAAARVRSLSVRDIARRLDDRFALLRDPSSHLPDRRRALAGAIGWSYDLLFPDDQRGLWALSCFAGSASLDAAEHVVEALGVPRGAVLDTMARLVDRSLVSVDGGAGAVRYRLLDSIRAYAGDRLREAGQTEVAAAAHAEWYAETASWCEAHVRGERQTECVAIARAERMNTDAGLAWCRLHDPLLGVRIANGFGWTWVVLGDGTAGAARVRQALTRAIPARERATGLLLAGWLEASAGDVALAQTDLDAARAIAADLGDDVLRADVDRHQAFLAIQQGRPDDVLSSASASLATYRPLSMDWRTAGSLLLAAFGSLLTGDTSTAARDATESLGILRRLGDSWGMVHAEAMIGGIAQAEHRFDDAARALNHAAEESRRLGFLGQAALHLATLGRVQQRAGNTHEAASTFERAIGDAVAGGDGRLAATARLNLARLRRSGGESSTAITLLEQNQRWYDDAGGGEGALLTRCVLAATAGEDAALQSVLADAVSSGNDEVRVYALDALARASAAQGDREHAQRLLEEADSLAPAVAHLVDEQDRLDKSLAREHMFTWGTGP
jgi:predicted ATPase/DNA-binding SARP family transcriptional activator